MRKAASHFLQSSAIAGFLGLVLALTFVVSASAYSVDNSKPTSGDGKPGDGVSGIITISGHKAFGKVTNSTNQAIDAGIASYKKVTQDGIADQKYYSSEVFTVGAGQTKTVSINIPCWAQVDLFRVYGSQFSVIKDFSNGDRYAERMLYAVHTKNECDNDNDDDHDVKPVTPILECIEFGQSQWTAKWGYNNPNKFDVTIPYGADNNFSAYGPDRGQPAKFKAGRHDDVFMTLQGENTTLSWTLNGKTVSAGKGAPVCAQRTPAPSVSPEPSSSPEESTTPSASPEVTAAPSGTPRTDLTDGRSDNLGCSVHDCSGNVVPTGGVVAGVSTTRTLPSTGSMNYAVFAIVAAVFGFGVWLRIKANRDEKLIK